MCGAFATLSKNRARGRSMAIAACVALSGTVFVEARFISKFKHRIHHIISSSFPL
jgi:hypothetical protein